MRRAVRSLARWVSIVAHPFVVCLLMVGIVAVHLEPAESVFRSVWVIAAFVVLPLAVLIVVQMWRGEWTTVDASRPQERPLLFWVGLGGLIALLVYLKIFQPGSFLIKGVMATLAMVAACALSARWVKVSLHCACAAQAATVLLILGSPMGIWIVPLVPALAWSRIELGRHRWLEVVIGTALGAISGWWATV